MARPTGNWAYLQLHFTGQEKEMTNTLWFTPSAVPQDYANLFLDAQALLAKFAPLFVGCMSSVITCRGGYFCVGSATGSMGIKVYQTFKNSNVDTALPEETTAVVSLDGTAGGNIVRGMLRIGGLAADAVLGSYLAPAYIGSLNALIEALESQINAGARTYSPSVWSPKKLTLAKIGTAAAVALVGSARRRLARF